MYDLAHYEQNDATFIDDLKESQQYVWRAAQWLSTLGYNVTVRPVQIRPHVGQMSEYADSGDLEIIQRVEVKRRPSLRFTCREDYPYPTAIVDVAHTWDNARPKPYAYIVFNGDASACLVIKGATSRHWVKTVKHDRAKSRERTFYECPVEYCQFYQMQGESACPKL